MKKLFRFIKWLIIIPVLLVILTAVYIRFSRLTDRLIYEMNDTEYTVFKSKLNHEEFYFDRGDEVKLHGVLFKPQPHISPIGTIFHYAGKGMHLMTSVQQSYKPLLEQGFQVFCFERRDFGKSTGEADNSLTLKEDALFVFDEVKQLDEVSGKPIVLWGQSLGGAFATMNAKERQHEVNGLILEGTFNSFPDIGKEYARVLHLEDIEWVVPLLMNNDFPADHEIKDLKIPVLIMHSKTDAEVPYELGRKLYDASNKENTEFWDLEGKHIMGIYDYKESYVEMFGNMMQISH